MRIVIGAIIITIQIYFYLSSKHLFFHTDRYKSIYTYLYLLYSISFVLCFVFFQSLPDGIKKNVFPILFLLIFIQLISCIFFLIEDSRTLLSWLFHRSKKIITNSQEDVVLSRYNFIKWLGLGLGGTLAMSFIYGFSNKYNYQIHRLRLRFKNLPQAFSGLRIVQISDIHSGSFDNRKAVQKGIQKILDLKPDLIFFTGDLVNNLASELEPYKTIFAQLSAPLGVYSILGNHDYGSYVSWSSPQAKQDNLNRLKQHHADMGWKLLLNEHVIIEKNKQTIALLGVENWSAKNFETHGDLQQAQLGTEAQPFSILLSHDPSHWRAEILKKYPRIDLTLSGHTHGMQFGVELGNWKWSPVKYVYPEWAGLYEQGTQKLYVNRGFGFIGYNGRVGILPEITLIELLA